MPPGYSTGEVARLLEVSTGQVRSYVRSGLVIAERGPRREYRFSFPDLVLLRVARDLVAARIPRRRIRRALEELTKSLPEGRGLSGLRIGAEGDHVVVHDGTRRWSPESGQLHFTFDIDDLARRAAPIARRQGREARASQDERGAADWYDLACDLEAPAPDEARHAYERALALDPDHADAHVNLGRLLHEAGEAKAAEHHYRAALAADPTDATAAFNLGVVLEDLRRDEDALAAYRAALRLDRDLPDAHYNAATLYEKLGDSKAALRHLKRYRELVR